MIVEAESPFVEVDCNNSDKLVSYPIEDDFPADPPNGKYPMVHKLVTSNIKHATS